MEPNDVINALNNVAPELKAFGVESAMLFGSLARGDHDEYSDIDIALKHPEGFELDPSHQLTLSGIINDAIYKQFGRDIPIDVVIIPARKPELNAGIEKDSLIAF